MSGVRVRFPTFRSLLATLLAPGALLLSGCGGTDGPADEGVDSASFALTSAQARILGFEAPTSDWRSTNGAISSTSTKTEGTGALQLASNGYTEIYSVPLEVPHVAATGVSFDLRLSAAVGWGDARVVLKAPSAGVYWQDLGSVPLSGRTAGTFSTVTLNSSAMNFLAGSATDLEIRLVLNAPSGVTVQLDHFVFLGTSAPPVADSRQMSITVPVGQPVNETFISAREKVTIDDRSTLGETGKLEKISSLGTTGSEFGAGVQTHADVLSKGKVAFLRSAAHIYGGVTSGDAIVRQNDTAIDGTAAQFQDIQTATNSWQVTFPSATGGSVSHPPDAPNRDLAPGSYSSFQIYSRATLTLRSGVYYFDSLRTEPQAHLRVRTVSGPVIIYVKNDVTLNAPLEYPEGERGQSLFGVFGTSPVILQQAFAGVVVAPNAAVELRRPDSGIHEGSFFGKDVHVFSDATVKFLPFNFAFLCPAGDADRDGILDCYEECVLDKKKTEAGICGCGVSEKDTDGDGLPDCQDECDHDPNHQSRGTCGCVGESDLKPAGTACSDGIADGTFTCDGAGTCGNPNSVAPEAGCALSTLGTHAYWVCPDQTSNQAAARCNAAPGRRLVRIDSKIENLVLAKRLTKPGMIGATDRTNEGEWTWQFTTALDDAKFWAGGASGKSFGNLYSAFAGGKPSNPNGNDVDCAVLDPATKTWTPSACTVAAPYICESLFGPSRNPGAQTGLRPILGPEKFYPNYHLNSDGASLNTQCEVWNDRADVLSTKYGDRFDPGTIEVWDCDEKCGPEAADTPELRAQCRAQYCKGDAVPPPDSAPACSDPGGSLTKLTPLNIGIPSFFAGACRIDDPKTPANEQDLDCSGSPVTVFNIKIKDTTCGVLTKCLQFTDDSNGKKVSTTCSSSGDCASGNYCDLTLKKCINPKYLNACGDQYDGQILQTRDGDGNCYGKCYDAVGCGVPINEEAAAQANTSKICHERNLCIPGGQYIDPLEVDSDLSPSEASTTGLKDQSELPPPAYSGDFSTACGSAGCGGCKGDANGSCDRTARHPWCNAEASLPPAASPTAGVTDNKEGHRGKDEEDHRLDNSVEPSPVSFDLDPKADLNFTLNPLPFGLATFDLKAIAAIAAVAKFDFAGIRGSITVVNLKAQLTASLCRVTTKDSRAEVLGIDFIPQIKEKTGVIFDTKDMLPDDTKKCEEAVATFVDTVDRAKKALRDTQELIRQYEALKAKGETFDDKFCPTVAGAGMRPKNMPGWNSADPCAKESVEDTINAFISYYSTEAGAIKAAKDTLAANVLNTGTLVQLLNLGDKVTSYAGFDFYAGLGNGFGDERTTTIINLNFMIGPIPANLEVSSYVGYGVDGGFGANLRPAVLVAGSGEFATAGVVVTPYADAGVTLFVGAGFDAGPVSLKLGIDGSVTLANVRLPITGKAGLAVASLPDDRVELPPDLANLTDGLPVIPDLARKKSSFQFTYSYGVSLSLENMLAGHINASLIIEFFFFSQKFSQELLSFSGLPPIQVNLLSGGSPEPSQWPANPVKEESRGWASGYDSLVLYGLKPLTPPETSLTKTTAFDNSKVSQLFYDSLCGCEEANAACDRDADCCGNSGSNPYVCFSDPRTGGAQKCSACRMYEAPSVAKPAGIFETCNEPGDCCSNNCVEGQTIYSNCKPASNCANANWKSTHETECAKCNDFDFCMANRGEGICAGSATCDGLAGAFGVPAGIVCDSAPSAYKTCGPPLGDGGGVVK